MTSDMQREEEEAEEERGRWELEMSEKSEDCQSPLLKSWRFRTTIIAMLATVQLMMVRMSLSMALVCMVEPPPLPLPAHGANITEKFPTCGSQHGSGSVFMGGSEATPLKQRSTKDFDWSKTLQGHLLSSYFYGYIAGILPGGLAVDRWGGRGFMLASIGVITATSFILPAAAYTHHAALYAVRVVQGLVEALGLNAHQFLLARWGSCRDLSLLTGISYIGFPLGVMVAHPLVSTLCLHGPWGGWPSVFYLLGATGSLWTIAAAFLLHNSPASHPYISQEEIRYFHRYGPKINQSSRASGGMAVWRRLVKSGPVWALVGTSVFGSFGYFAFTLHQPLFLRDVFGFSIEENGVMSSLPWSIEVPVAVAVGVAVDVLRRRGVSLTTTKKFLNTLGFLMAGLIPLVVVEVGCEWRWVAATCLLLVVAGNCTAFVGGYYYTPVDLAPPWAATLSGLTSTFIGLNGLAAPLTVAHLTPTGSRGEWRWVFRVSGGLYLAGTVVFLIWGSAKPLPGISTSSPPADAIPNKPCTQEIQQHHQEMNDLMQQTVKKNDPTTVTEESR